MLSAELCRERSRTGPVADVDVPVLQAGRLLTSAPDALGPNQGEGDPDECGDPAAGHGVAVSGQMTKTMLGVASTMCCRAAAGEPPRSCGCCADLTASRLGRRRTFRYDRRVEEPSPPAPARFPRRLPSRPPLAPVT